MTGSPSFIAVFMIASPFGASSVLALKSSLEPGISSCTELSAMSWKIFVFSSSKSRICLSFCWSCSVGVNRKQAWRQKIKALAKKPEWFLRYWPHLVEYDSMCWVWQHSSALGNLAQQAQKINNARKASCKPGLQLLAGCRTEKSHSSTTKHNPKTPIHFSTMAPQLCSRQVLPFSPLTFASDNFFSNSDSQGTPSSSSLSLDRRHGSITTGTHPVHPLPPKNSWVSYMVCIVSWMICIQPLRSSLELAWTSTISGSLPPMLIRNKPFSSWATSRTISFFREITVDFWSFRWKEMGEESDQS